MQEPAWFSRRTPSTTTAGMRSGLSAAGSSTGAPAPDDPSALEERTRAALKRGGRAGELGAHVPPDEIDELRIVSTYLASHPDTTQLALERDGDREGVYRNGSSTTSAVVLSPSPTVTTVPAGASRRTSASAIGPSAATQRRS